MVDELMGLLVCHEVIGKAVSNKLEQTQSTSWLMGLGG